MKALAIDFETANSDRFSPCALGLVWINDDSVVRREYRLIRPKEMRFGFHQTRVHGLRAEDVEDAPEFPDVITEFLPDIAANVLLAHNASFDVDVLCATLAVYGKTVPPVSYICTQLVSRCVWPSAREFNLAAVAGSLGFEFWHHNALDDASACAHIAIAAANKVGAADISGLCRSISIRMGRVDRAGWISCETIRRVGQGTAAANYSKMHASHSAVAQQRNPDGLRFMVKGRTGRRYEIAAEKRNGSFGVRCSCVAGQNRRRCWHVTALLDGDVTNLLSDSITDVETLRRMVDAFGDGFPDQQRAVRGSPIA